jgi:AAA domain/Primase C terminal 2 (PriCT-2)/RepB DNA-primase from phage plasmid
MTDIYDGATTSATPQHHTNPMRFRPMAEKQFNSEREEYGNLYLIFDGDAAERFLAALDPSTDRFTFQTFDDSKKRKAEGLACVRHGTLQRWGADLCKLNAEGAGIFITVNATTLAGRRIADNVKRVRALFVDFDKAGPLPTFHVKPHIIVESSQQKFHAYWLVKDCPLDQFTVIQERLIKHYGSDPVPKDLPRVMRLPGFFHRKDDAIPFRSRLIEANDDKAYALAEVMAGISTEEKSNGVGASNDSNPFEAFGASNDSNPWTAAREARLRSALDAIPTDEATLNAKGFTRRDGTSVGSHGIWIDIGRAIERLGWGDKGLSIWRDWSKKSSEYNESGLRIQWQSFGRTRSEDESITIGTVFWYAQGFGWRDRTKIPNSPTIVPQPYVCKDPKTLPRRDWLYGYFLIRKYVGVDFAPGGTGKSNHSFVEACAMASGKNLLGVQPRHRLRVWYWNLEDTPDEIDKRIEAIRIQYKLKSEDIDDHLFVNHGRLTPLVIGVTDKDGSRIIKPVVDNLIAAIREAQIDVVIVDPFVSSHRIPENDNTAIDMIAKEWSIVCEEGDCAVRLTHHTRKGDQEITSDSGRGASALRDAGRICRVFNLMTKDEAAKVGIEGEKRRRYYRTYDDKRNMAPPAEKSDWFYLESVWLDNAQDPLNPLDRGDSVGVTTPWAWPDDTARVTQTDFEECREVIQTGRWRHSPQANDWVGNAIADALGLDPENPAHYQRIKHIIAKWLTEGKLVKVKDKDENRKDKWYVEAP